MFGLGSPPPKPKKSEGEEQYKLQYEIGEIERAIYAKVVTEVRQSPPLGRVGDGYRRR